jgi:hemoglobin/transferrin/lactoferrin receptor protein
MGVPLKLPLGLFLLWSWPLHATAPDTDDSIDVYDIDEIVVTASRRAENALVVPYTVNVQDMRELLEVRQVRTTPEAMREIPGVMVQKTGHGQGSPYIRGFTGLRTLFLIDGIRLNNSTFREGPNQYWNTVDPLMIQRMELVKGPSSVLYGSDAIGGTVNVFSRSYADLEAEQSSGRLVLRGASAEDSLIARAETGFAGDTLDVLVGVSFKGFGDLRAGGDTGTQPRTGYDERDADIKLAWSLAENRRIVAALQYTDQDDAWRVHKTVYGQSWRGTTTGNELRRSLDQRRMLAYLQYHLDGLTALRGGDLAVGLSQHRQDEERLRVRADGRTDLQGTDVGTLGLFAKVDIPAQNGHWTAGIDFYRDDVDSFRLDYNADGTLRGVGIQGPVADDATYTIADAYVQRRLDFSERGELTAGVRYSWSRAHANAVQNPLTGERIAITDDWGKLTGSLRYSRELGRFERVRWFAGVSQGFRAPNLSDLTRFDSARSNEIETPVSGLRPENFVTWELGLKFDRDRWAGQASIYYTSIRDMIIRTPTGEVIDGDNEITKRNSGDGSAQGLELQARYRLSDDWAVFGNLTWMDGDVETYPDSSTVLVKEPLDRLMPLQAYLGLHWEPAGSDHWLAMLLSTAGNADKLSTRDVADTDRIPAGGTPGYAILSLRGGWHVSDDWRVSIAAENVLDKNYRVHGSGLNEPGRNLLVTLFRRFR